ncbi:30S ribosomal protein S17 [Candidatus Roizmanbacteria bacterium]|nr:30S ribosomal protein S17 [Candidatus Roizmanbacteria bacterium]
MKKTLQGIVISMNMQKTAVVVVERTMRHPVYHKILRRTKRYKAHVEGITVQTGDHVQLVETRPYSKEKRYRIEKVMTG